MLKFYNTRGDTEFNCCNF